MSDSPHVMILASAGSGKTYELTNRFIALLAAGAPPERIAALTFTRKAAGEFFDEILHKLADAASDPSAAARLAAALKSVTPRTLGESDFLKMLRVTIDAMPRLRLGTLDSFFAQIARAFPLELGLDGEFEILQEHAARMERRKVLARMFTHAGRLATAQADFVEAFKRATFGSEEKQLGARLDAFLDRYQENYLAAPELAIWGNSERIWPGGSRWLSTPPKLVELVAALRDRLPTQSDGQMARWDAFFAALEEWTPGGGPLPKPVEYILGNVLDVWQNVCGGGAEVVIERRKLALNSDTCRALEQLITTIIGAELQRRIETTRGIFAVLRSYESTYHDIVRRAGRLTFADVQRLLAPTTLARTPATGDESERRLVLDYRLDAEIDHWLLDEFQDTSFGQWSILRNLIDEVVQDPEGRRTFFCVGDVKQAIYAWREGDARLFREIFEHYNTAMPGAIGERHLDASWRSGPAIIEMVNAIFGSAAALSALFPGAASEQWNREWRTHCSARPERVGQAALLQAGDEAQRWETMRRLLEEIRPLERGLSVAVLVKKNDTAAGIADYLRRIGIAAIADADLHIATDNPIGAAWLALIKAAAHPGDTLAREHVRMTPLERILAARGLEAPEALTRHVLAQIHHDGFERTADAWMADLDRFLDRDDSFSRRRAREIAAAAAMFDATGSRDLDEFVAFMERHAVRPPDGAAAVRVMTIHKAKGLGFDVVILPDLEGNRIDERREGLAVFKGRDRSIEWILDLPPRLLCIQDETLSRYLQSAEADACYENLSLLYVALTRAKRGMYVITEPVGKSKSRNFPRLLADTLGGSADEIRVGGAVFGGTWSRGDPNWFAAHDAPTPQRVVITPEPPLIESTRPGLRRRIVRRASIGKGTTAGAPLFELSRAAALEFGTELHALLAEIEWAEAEDASRSARLWRSRHSSVAVAAAEACLKSSNLAHVWARPADWPMAEVWRERPFEVVLDDAWLTGVFDRVVVGRDDSGRARRVSIFDFKTDRIGDDLDWQVIAARHGEQLRTYRKVAAILTGVAPAEIRCELVLTAVQRTLRID